MEYTNTDKSDYSTGGSITQELLNNPLGDDKQEPEFETLNITSNNESDGHTVTSIPLGIGIPDKDKNLIPNQEPILSVDNQARPGNRCLSCNKKYKWQHLTIISLLIILLIVLSIGLTLDGYITKIIPDILIGIAFLAYMIVVYIGYVNQTPNPLVLDFIKVLEIDTQDTNKRKILYFLSVAISMTPGYVLSHGYVTSGPPGFFPSSVFPLLLVIATLLLTLRDGFLRGYWAFNAIMWIFLIDMIATSQIPSRPESSAILTVRIIYTVAMILIAIYTLFRYILKFDRRIRNLIIFCVLITIISCNIITLTYQGGWVWKNYLYPTYDMFPHDVIVGANKAYYLPIVSRREYRYKLIPVGSTPYHAYISFNITSCNDYPPALDDDITLSLLWMVSILCHPIEVGLAAQAKGYDAVVFNNIINNFTQITVVPEIDIQLFILNHNPNLMYNNLNGQPRTYTVITRFEDNLWSKPSSYLFLLLPIITSLLILIIINIVYLRTISDN